ncbi:hypothetical protein AB0Q95_44665 [Streptomyces sp. NPDC059900]|uniref:hypothetical protein n=1 Tax=Streptomyces sp. NPDC059900 TaxID=3155816 RepID=UPI003439584F
MKQLPAIWLVLHVVCTMCKAQAARFEFTPPGLHPLAFSTWPPSLLGLYARQRDPARWWLIAEGDIHANGHGENIAPQDVHRYREAFGFPRTFTRVRSADITGDAGFCPQCDVPYCATHWHATASGRRRCPRGHDA